MDAYMSVRTNMREPYRIEDSPEVFDLANYVCFQPCDLETESDQSDSLVLK